MTTGKLSCCKENGFSGLEVVSNMYSFSSISDSLFSAVSNPIFEVQCKYSFRRIVFRSTSFAHFCTALIAEMLRSVVQNFNII